MACVSPGSWARELGAAEPGGGLRPRARHRCFGPCRRYPHGTIAVIARRARRALPAGECRPFRRRSHANGAVVAEAPLSTAPVAKHFPKRNRIIAGLVLGLVVIEAAARSGSLLTARLANESGRELFGVPGSPLDPRSAGANDLIRQGMPDQIEAADVAAPTCPICRAARACPATRCFSVLAPPGFAGSSLPLRVVNGSGGRWSELVPRPTRVDPGD